MRIEETIELNVENLGLNAMVGKEFDMMDFILTKSIIRSQLEEAAKKGEESLRTEIREIKKEIESWEEN